MEQIHKADALRASIGDVVRLSTAGGGGHGDPLERDAHRVLDDVLNGFVTLAGAERDYGVVVRNSVLDAAATARLRESRRSNAAPALYTLGPARVEYERIWNDEVSKAMTDIVFGLPQAMRYEVRARLWRAMEQRRSEGPLPDTAALRALWSELRLRLEKSALRLDKPAGEKAA